MPTITASPGLVVDLWPQGSPGDPVRSPAVRIRRAGGASVVVYLPEVRGLVDALARAASETAGLVVDQDRER
ncbi:MAG: hypothetical protein KKA73_12670 [Chloroflexi bacterium]|nr:hypothetical protein [Chloroflexota bacterium]